MTAWNAGMRDQAARGLIRLLARSSWRDSDIGPALTAAVGRLVDDPNPVVRMQAAPGVALLHSDENPEQRLAAIRGRLLVETNPYVLNILIQLLSNLAGDVPAQVDDVLSELSRLPTGGFLCSQTRPAGDPGAAAETTGPLLAYLATVPRTPFAIAALDGWFSDPVTHQDRAEPLLHDLRRFLNPPNGEGRENAFRLLAAAAQAVRDTWLAHMPQEFTTASPIAEPEMARIRAAALVAHGIAEQLYVASGAFDGQPGSRSRQPSGAIPGRSHAKRCRFCSCAAG